MNEFLGRRAIEARLAKGLTIIDAAAEDEDGCFEGHPLNCRDRFDRRLSLADLFAGLMGKYLQATVRAEIFVLYKNGWP